MKKYLYFIAIIGAMVGCQSEKKEYASSTNELNTLSDSVAVADDSTAAPKLIKTADMRFKVKDVQHTKVQISEAVKAQGGVITEFEIQSSIQEQRKVKYSIDSLNQITAYRKEAVVTAKVPSEKLDDFINDMSKMAVFVDQQAMRTDDQGIVYLANQLKLNNRKEALKTIDETAKRKGNNVATALDLKDDAVDKKIENLSIDSRVKLSTITLSFYQDNTVQSIIIANDRINDYGPGFFKRLLLNLGDGWDYFAEFMLILANLWALIAVALILFLGFRYFNKSKKTVVVHSATT
jgi:hypothetical protein